MSVFCKGSVFASLLFGLSLSLATNSVIADVSFNIETAAADHISQNWCDQADAFADFDIENTCKRYTQQTVGRSSATNDIPGYVVNKIHSGTRYLTQALKLKQLLHKTRLSSKAKSVNLPVKGITQQPFNAGYSEVARNNFSVALDPGLSETMLKFVYKF